MNSQYSRAVSKIVLGLLAIYFFYVFVKAIEVANRRHISTDDGVYINSTNSSEDIKKLAERLTKNCSSQLCEVENILNYVTNIPYRVNNYQAHSPQDTIQKNFGDCDDKSNLLISLLHAKELKSYFVLVPKHIFVIVSHRHTPLPFPKKGLYINGEKFYILESTAKNSTIGFPLHYHLHEIKAIIEPFSNKKIDISTLKWKL